MTEEGYKKLKKTLEESVDTETRNKIYAGINAGQQNAQNTAGGNSSSSSSNTPLTAEAKAKIEANRKAALERKIQDTTKQPASYRRRAIMHQQKQKLCWNVRKWKQL